MGVNDFSLRFPRRLPQWLTGKPHFSANFIFTNSAHPKSYSLRNFACTLRLTGEAPCCKAELPESAEPIKRKGTQRDAKYTQSFAKE